MTEVKGDNTYRIIFSDSFSYRHAQFRLRGAHGDQILQQVHCHSMGELIYTLKQKVWDVVFVAGYYEKHDALPELIQHFCKLEEAKRPRLVIFHGTTDDFKFVPQLRNVGYLATHIPWDFAEPQKHERRDPKEYFGVDKLQQLLLPTYTANQGA